MEIEKVNTHLSVTSNIYFDENVFCIRPYVHLVACKNQDYSWKEYTIGIAVHDYDDFDIGLIYYTTAADFDDVLHELINWMRDHEQGVSSFKKLLSPYDFFPDCGCKRSYW